MNLTSEVNWMVASAPPKTDRTIIIFNRLWPKQVDLGYIEDGQWQTNDGVILDDENDCFSPTLWAELPEGPITK